MTIHLLHLSHYPIEKQLRLEEHLLREDERSWCLINEGTPVSIVLGISGKEQELVDCARAERAGIPLIRRFSGGGTVIVDEQTLFITFICQKELHPFPAYPEPILRWHEELYREVFSHPDFSLRENDFVIGERKCGGNAQYIKKDRWLQHTSFLWDYCPEKMSYLLLPKKMPYYRAARPHREFLCALKDHFSSKEEWIARFKAALKRRFTCEIQEITLTK